jgi:predicted metal-dependent hydrolase
MKNTERNEIAYADGMSLDWNFGALAEGLTCYRKAEFFEAHEHWESVWLTLQEPEKSFLQALIQITVAFHHLQAGNSAGMIALLRRALQRLELCPAHFGGIVVASLRPEVREWLRVTESTEPSIPATSPQICPIDLPAE